MDSDGGCGGEGVLLAPWKSFLTSNFGCVAGGVADDAFAVADTVVDEDVEGLPLTAGSDVA